MILSITVMPGIYTKPAVKGIHYLKLHLPLKASTMQTEVGHRDTVFG